MSCCSSHVVLTSAGSSVGITWRPVEATAALTHFRRLWAGSAISRTLGAWNQTPHGFIEAHLTGWGQKDRVGNTKDTEISDRSSLMFYEKCFHLSPFEFFYTLTFALVYHSHKCFILFNRTSAFKICDYLWNICEICDYFKLVYRCTTSKTTQKFEYVVEKNALILKQELPIIVNKQFPHYVVIYLYTYQTSMTKNKQTKNFFK